MAAVTEYPVPCARFRECEDPAKASVAKQGERAPNAPIPEYTGGPGEKQALVP
jgi:hypothetical protein